jgi:hypothetical protein
MTFPSSKFEAKKFILEFFIAFSNFNFLYIFFKIGSDGLQCEFKLRGLRIAKQATEKTTETATNANDDQMRESSSNIGQVEPQTTSEDSSQYIYK